MSLLGLVRVNMTLFSQSKPILMIYWSKKAMVRSSKPYSEALGRLERMSRASKRSDRD